MQTWAFALALGICIFCGCALVVNLAMGARARKVNRRITEVIRPIRTVRHRRNDSPQQRVSELFRSLRSQLGIRQSAALRDRFLAAGLRSNDSMELHFAARVLGPVAGMIAGTFVRSNTFFWVIGLAGVLYIAPNLWLDRRIAKRRAKIRRSIPDTVDLLVICVDAGLGLDQAMLRVGQELAVSHPEITEEFGQINREQRAGRPRIEAWQNMAARTKLPEIQAFVSMLVQTERFGTPIARALASFSDDLRLKRRQAAEEKAAKTTVKMLFPLVLFIFPCIFIVLLGPAIIAVSKGLFNMVQ